MYYRNFWLSKKNEKNILKVVEWAHRNSIKVEDLTVQQIIESNTSHIRHSSHS